MTGRPVKDARNAFLPSLVEIMHTPYCNLDKKETCDKIADADLKNKGTASESLNLWALQGGHYKTGPLGSYKAGEVAAYKAADPKI